MDWLNYISMPIFLCRLYEILYRITPIEVENYVSNNCFYKFIVKLVKVMTTEALKPPENLVWDGVTIFIVTLSSLELMLASLYSFTLQMAVCVLHIIYKVKLLSATQPWTEHSEGS